MKANELRIGNLVKSGKGIYLVSTISEFEIMVLKSVKDGEYIECSNVIYQPIPLTEEWLIKFGFERQVGTKGCNEWILKEWSIEDRSEESDSFLKDNPDIIDCFGVWRWDVYLHDIKHVHQLQNLYFALTGEELTIKE